MRGTCSLLFLRSVLELCKMSQYRWKQYRNLEWQCLLGEDILERAKMRKRVHFKKQRKEKPQPFGFSKAILNLFHSLSSIPFQIYLNIWIAIIRRRYSNY